MTHLPPEDENPIPGEFLLYAFLDGKIRLDLRIYDETLWMTQQVMAELFQAFVENIYEEVDLEQTCKKSLQVRQEGMRQVRRSVSFLSEEIHLNQ